VSVTTNRSANADEIAYNTPSVEAITEFTVDTNVDVGTRRLTGLLSPVRLPVPPPRLIDN
jgi:hypothetical protein